ncbi:hypothetical protein CON64_20440 [Bacillus pseudomycoides]|nr:hypothetical protein CON64_20440 [Bacillus pseudomycoides]
MSNYYVFDNVNNPVSTKSINTFNNPSVVSSPENSASKSGVFFFTTATNSQSLGILGGSVIITLQISNPSGSGKTLYVSSISGGTGVSLSLLSSFTASMQLIQGGTLTSPTTLTPFNANLQSSNTSVMTARSSTSAVSGGTTFMNLPLQPGQFFIDYTGSIIVPPSKSISITINASLSVAGVLSTNANISWWEY